MLGLMWSSYEFRPNTRLTDQVVEMRAYRGRDHPVRVITTFTLTFVAALGARQGLRDPARRGRRTAKIQGEARLQ